MSLGTTPGDEKNGETNNVECNDTKPANLNKITGINEENRNHSLNLLQSSYQIRFFIWLHHTLKTGSRTA